MLMPHKRKCRYEVRLEVVTVSAGASHLKGFAIFTAAVGVINFSRRLGCLSVFRDSGAELVFNGGARLDCYDV